MSKKVLVICYYWPPAGGPGVQRWLKFVKYLPEFGVDPVVFVPENPNYPIVDTSLSKEVPSDVEILKFPIKEPYKIASKLSRKHTNSISSGIVPRGRQSFLQKLLLFVRGNFFVPDARVGWVKPSVSFLTNYLEKHDINTIITSGPPHSLHLIGMHLKDLKKELNWIADFRDPWTTIGYHDKLKMTSRTKAKHKVLEKKVLNTADRVVVTSPSTEREFALITAKPIHVITNGYDDEILSEQLLDDTFTLSHIGSLLSDRNPIVLWECLAEMVKDSSDFANNLRIKLAGKISAEVVATIREFGLEKQLEILGYVSHTEALKLQRKAAVLLLIEIDSENTRGIIPGKLFEYMSAKRPIVALGPKDSDIETIFKTMNQGEYLLYVEKEKLKKTLLRLYASYKAKENTIETENLEKFHRKNLTKSLVEVILN